MDRLIKILLFTAFLNATAWIILIPVWQYPDEQAHFAQIQYTAELGKIPKEGFDTSYEIAFSEKLLGTERDGLGNNKFTYHPEYKIDYSATLLGPHEEEITALDRSKRKIMVKREATQNPPLYYFLGSLIYKIFSFHDLFTRVYAIRFLSAFFFLANIFVCYRIGKLIFEDNQLMPLFLSSTLAFTPMFTYASTGILPDPLTNFLFSLILLFGLKIFLEGLKLQNFLLLLICLILGVLTRQQFLIALPIVAIPVIKELLKKPSFLKKVILPTIICFAIIYGLSFVVPVLSFITSFSAPEVGRTKIHLIVSKDFSRYFLSFVKQTIAQTLPWYWGVYKWLSLTVPKESYRIINRIIILSAVGLSIYFFNSIRKKNFGKEKQAVLFLALASAFYFLVFGIWDYLFESIYHYHFGFQGRYFFPLISAHFIILIVGQREISGLILKKFAAYYLFLLVLLVFIFNIISLVYVSASYYDMITLKSFIIQASQYKPQVFKGNMIILILTCFLLMQVFFLSTFAKFIVNVKEKQI